MKKILFWFLVPLVSFLLLGVYLYWERIGEIHNEERPMENVGIGVLAPESEMPRYQAIVDYLNNYSDDSWKLVPMKDYASFLKQFEAGQIGAGFVGSLIGYKFIDEKMALPVVRGEKNGRSHYYGYVIARKNEGVDSIADLKGKVFAYFDPFTSAGFLVPRNLIKNAGYNPEDFFALPTFSSSYKEALEMVLNGKADGAAVKDSTWAEAVKIDPAVEEKLQIIAKGGPFPENTFFLRIDETRPDEINELRKMFAEMENSSDGKKALERFGADKFVVTDVIDFKIVEDLLKQED